MANESYIRARIDNETKQQAMEILKSQGWNMSDFLRCAVQSVVNEQKIPFQREVPELSEADIRLFGNIERAAKSMTKESLMKSLGLR